MTDLSLLLVAVALVIKNSIPHSPCTALTPPQPRNTSGYGFHSAPTSCLSVCCTVHRTVMTPFTSCSPQTWTNFYSLIQPRSPSPSPSLLLAQCGYLPHLPWLFSKGFLRLIETDTVSTFAASPFVAFFMNFSPNSLPTVSKVISTHV